MKMIIGGEHTESSDGRTIDVINPATGEVVDTMPLASKEDIDRALDNAKKGFSEWSAVPLYGRIDILKKFMDLCAEHIEEIARLLVAEMGKPISSARGEVMGAIGKTEAYLEGARLLKGETVAAENRHGTDGNLVITLHQPLGVVVGFIPFNFPIITMASKVIPALVMGNAVVAKPASDTPLSGVRFVELLLEAGVPGNAIQLVTGSGGEIGNLLAGDPRVDAVTLTGSTETGATVASIAARTIKRVSLELGGNDAVIILPDADLDSAVCEVVAGRIENSGQLCCSAKRCIVHNSVKDAFLKKLIAALKEVKVGDPTSEETDCGPLVSKKAAITLEEQVARNVGQGAKILFGGRRFREAFFEPTVLDANANCEAMHNMELFGPVWTVAGFDTTNEAIAAANDCDYGLNSAVIGRDINELMKCAKSLEAGTCVINGSSFFIGEDSPFGGRKRSGIGRESAQSCLEEMSELKTILFKRAFR
jgi:succinate-semialdehyde dehydrogenase/glutarate-semialdehyde dehydrogenase